jgi:Phage P22-like portal protein
MDVAKTYQSNLARIKERVRKSYDYFKPNYDRYNEFRKFVFDSSLTSDEITLLMTLSKPQLEFNVMEAYISRLLGEFSKQEPDIEVSADDQNVAEPVVIKVIEQHLRHTLSDQDNHHTRYEVYKDILSGGFSVMKVTTDYAHPMSFNQVINIERAFDPTLCGFDQLARMSHKGDGQFCYELFPKSKDEFLEEYPDIPLDEINFRRDFAGFNWSYLNDSTPIIMVCDYYEKKKKKTTIVQTSDGKVVTQKKYKEMLDSWNDFSVPPVIVGKPRTTMIETICRYRLIENRVLEYEETDFTMLPLVFCDGNSVLIKTPKNGNVRQVTRPYIYHAKGAQRLKNYAGIALANEIENTVQHKFMVAKEALPKEEEYLQAYKDVQKADVLVYNSVYEEDPNQPIGNPVREVAKVPAPPEIVQAFTGADQLMQGILGNYDASLGINNNQLSGTAIVEAATQSNATAMPYIVGYMQGLQRVAQIYVDLMPKYYTTPSTLPIMDEEGKKSYIKTNQQDGIDMFFDSNALNVIVKAGASFQVQKSRTIMMVKEIMGMSPQFAQFIAEKGLTFVLDNLEGRGIEQLKSMVDGWLKELAQQKQMMMQQQQQEIQNNPAMLKAQNDAKKLELEAQKSQGQFAVDMAKLQAGEAKVMADLQSAKEANLVQIVKANAERFSKGIDLQLKKMDMHHRHNKEIIELHHTVTRPEKETKQGHYNA